MKILNLTLKDKKAMLTNFKKLLATYDGDGAISITPPTITSKKVTVYITTTAWFKINALIKAYDKELAWHGIAERYGEDYLIKDIIVYPQIAAAATVESDDDKYAAWCMGLPDDIINNLRFQGHSHVNMGVTPSGTDIQNWQEFLNILGPDDFYIFCIGNKSTTFYWKLFDNKKNIMFENTDILYKVVNENNLEVLTEWADKTIKDNIKNRTVVSSTSTWDSSKGYSNHRAIGPSILKKQTSTQDVYIDDEIACTHYPALGIVICEDAVKDERLAELGFVYSYYYDDMVLNAEIARRTLKERVFWGTVYNRKNKSKTIERSNKK